MSFTQGVVEIQDDINSTPKNINGVVALAGTPSVITAPDSSNIQLALVKNPSKGPNANSQNMVLLVNIDGAGAPQYISIARGESYYIPGGFASLKIDSTVNGSKYEAVIWY